MKKVFFSIAIFFFATYFLTAQETTQEIRYGVKIGGNLSTIIGDVEDKKIRPAFHVGAVVEFPIAQDFFFAPEFLYSSQGAQRSKYERIPGVDDLPGKDFYEETSIRLNYIAVPFMFKYYVADRFSLELGPHTAILISAKEHSEFNNDGEITSSTVDIKESTSNIDYGLNVGLGYQMDNGLFFQGRYYFGLGNIYDFPGDSDSRRVQHSVMQLSIGFMFN